MSFLRMQQLLLGLVWCAVAVCWPVLRWLIGLDVLCQLVRWLALGGPYSLLRVGSHFAVLVALSWFVDYYRPGNLTEARR